MENDNKHMLHRWISLLCIGLFPIMSYAENLTIKEDSHQATASTVEKKDQPMIVRLPDGMLQLGEITFDPKTRNIRVPCKINMIEGLLEFALVHENGSIHESLLVTTASPMHLNVAMKMLNYTPSEELYAIEKEKGVSSGKFPQVTEEVRKAARIQLSLEFTKDQTKTKKPLRELVLNNVTEKTMIDDDWIYGGSIISDGNFHAETSGEIASIFVSRGSLLLFAGKENQNDEVWIPNAKHLPEVGANAFFIIEPKNVAK